MPGPIIALYLILAGAGTALLGPPRAWSRVDPTVNRSHYKPAKVEYMTSVSAPERKKFSCVFTGFAWATREKLTRVQIDGVEQLLDFSYTFRSKEIPAGEHWTVDVKFIDPISKEESIQTLREACMAHQDGT